MTEFSAVAAATSGYRLALKRPLLILAWAGIAFLAAIIMGAAMLAVMFPMLGDLGSLESGNSATAEAMARRILPIYGVLIPLFLLWSAIQQMAVNRLVLAPQDRGFAYYRIGGDEWRQILLTLVYFLLIVVWVAVWAGITFGVQQIKQDGFGVALAVLSQLVLAGLFIFLMVRLSLASALTFTRKRVSVFGSWAVTRGRFWPMLGAYLLAFVFTIAAVIALYILSFIVMLIAMGGSFAAAASGADPNQMASVMTPTVIILYLVLLPVSQVFGVVINLGMLAPAPDVLRQLTPETTVFD